MKRTPIDMIVFYLLMFLFAWCTYPPTETIELKPAAFTVDNR